MCAGVDQIEPDRRIRRNWAFCRRLLKGGRDRKGNGAERQWVAGSGGGGGLEGGLEDLVDAVQGADFC